MRVAFALAIAYALLITGAWWCEMQESNALRSQRDRALLACDPDW
jgi:hypothetical protein